MLKFNTDTIYGDVLNWTQSTEELAAWTDDEMRAELLNIFGDNAIVHDDGENITLEELASLYTETAHEIAKKIFDAEN